MHTRLFLIAAFAAVVATFVAATAYSLHELSSIDEAVRGISGAGVPTIHTGNEGRRALRDLEHAMQAAIDRAADGAPVDLTQVRAAEQRLDGETADISQRNLDRVAELRRAVQDLEKGVERTSARLTSGDVAGAQARELYDVEPLAMRADDQLLTVIDANAARVDMAAHRIGSTRRYSAHLALFLDGVAVLLTIVAAFFALRTIHRYTHLLERRADELEAFAGRVAHDVLSPLSTVKMACGVVEETPHAPEIEPLLARARSSVDRVQRLVDALLQFARAGARPPPDARCEVAPVLEDVREEVRDRAARENVQVECAVPPVAPVRCTAGALHSVVANLAHNAIKNMGKSGTRRVILRAQQTRGCVRIEVEDTGPGLPPEMEETAFEPYVRGESRTSGIGLGLATVKRVVTAHDGRVGVRSRPGKGACFWLELPTAPRSASST